MGARKNKLIKLSLFMYVILQHTYLFTDAYYTVFQRISWIVLFSSLAIVTSGAIYLISKIVTAFNVAVIYQEVAPIHTSIFYDFIISTSIFYLALITLSYVTKYRTYERHKKNVATG